MCPGALDAKEGPLTRALAATVAVPAPAVIIAAVVVAAVLPAIPATAIPAAAVVPAPTVALTVAPILAIAEAFCACTR